MLLQILKDLEFIQKCQGLTQVLSAVFPAIYKNGNLFYRI